jgi:phosphatidylserine/phosphatidylglycerophosphate/cardiolipin synthase-like enzyme
LAAPSASSFSPASGAATRSTAASTSPRRPAWSRSPPAASSSPTCRSAATPDIELRTLRDGGQTALEIAEYAAGFLAKAEKSLDLALYDFDLEQETAKLVATALLEAQSRGVEVRLAFNVDHDKPIPEPPPPHADPSLLDDLAVPTKRILGVPDLMHHKYVVRDGADVWTGSTNWSDDSWSREENVIAVVHSNELAERYTEDFEQLWDTESVEKSGFVEPNPIRVGDGKVRAWFSPGHGEALATRIAHRIAKSRVRIRICSPVMTSGPVLGALAEAVSDGKCDVAGVVDATQMKGVFHQWQLNGNSEWKMPAIRRIFANGRFTGKNSMPYGQGDVHDFMHAKVVVADDYLFTGSYNLSHSGERNAENVLEVEDSALADQLAVFVDEIHALYPAAPIP